MKSRTRRHTASKFFIQPISSESARNVVFGFFARRVLEDHIGRTELAKFSQEEKAGVIGNPSGLLHIVGDQDDRASAFQIHQ